ncbi:benzyl alcohol O-benzoyltransferase-like [Typha angustifolia]|uniref:benzyl alcohol O-benzoyltransferase-like n=1 Tax=Typha angustifolia TaxID=59011 RepID=UPI003C2B9FD3
MASSSVRFSVQRRQAVLVAPAEATPYELKRLSDIDDQEALRFQIPVIQFYRADPSMEGRDPAKVIREALAKALVFYYPFAGRIREQAGRKLVVECTGEGVLFIEADADIRLDQFGDKLEPPFPCLEELIFVDSEASAGVLNCPLLLIQVTRLACGGFIFGLRLNHTMSDGPGLVQFMNAVAELARGLPAPSVRPVWGREILEARNPPRPSFAHREYEEVPDTKGTVVPLDDMVHRSFFFGPREMAALRSHVPPQLRKTSSTFEILTACIWKCRTIAISPDPEEEMRMICIVSVRGRSGFQLPDGYYGNAFALPVAISTADKLCRNPLGYALELVKKAKAAVDHEYIRSVADLMVLLGRPHFAVVRAYLVSDLTRAGFVDVDFGWGKAVYGGPAKGGVGAIPGVASFYIPTTNDKGEKGIVVPVCLPAPAMNKFATEIDGLLKEPAANQENSTTSPHVMSAL